MNPVLAYRTLCAFAERGSRWFAVLVWSLFGIPALLAARYVHPGPDPVASGAMFSAMFFAVAAALAWFAYPNHGIRLAREARELAMPGWGRAVRAAFAWLLTLTVLLPALELTWFTGGDFPLWFGMIACGAFGGMLTGLVNYWFMVCMLPITYVLSHTLDALHLDVPKVLPPLTHANEGPMVAVLAVVLGFACRWRWLQQSRAGRVTAFARVEWGAERTDERSFGRLDPTKRRGPAEAMSVWLGPSILGGAAVSIASSLILFAFIASTSGLPKSFLSAGGLLLALWIIVPSSAAQACGPRLRSLFRPGNETLAELALVPGWGSADRARRTLVAAALRPALLLLAPGIALIAVCTWMHGAGVGTFVVIGAVVAALLATCAASCLVVLEGHRLGRDWVLTIAAFCAIVFGVTLGRILLGDPVPQAAAPITFALAGLWTTAMLSIAWAAWRRLAAKPHPFLTP